MHALATDDYNDLAIYATRRELLFLAAMLEAGEGSYPCEPPAGGATPYDYALPAVETGDLDEGRVRVCIAEGRVVRLEGEAACRALLAEELERFARYAPALARMHVDYYSVRAQGEAGFEMLDPDSLPLQIHFLPEEDAGIGDAADATGALDGAPAMAARVAARASLGSYELARLDGIEPRATTPATSVTGAPRTATPRAVHINLIARDWRALAFFYERVFDCAVVPPPRRVDAPWLAAMTGLAGEEAKLEGAHLRFPGAAGFTLELFAYASSEHLPKAASAHPTEAGENARGEGGGRGVRGGDEDGDREEGGDGAGRVTVPSIREPGWRHLAIACENVAATRARVLAEGGSALGEVIEAVIPDAGRLTACYVTDPEGNILELQRWA